MYEACITSRGMIRTVTVEFNMGRTSFPYAWIVEIIFPLVNDRTDLAIHGISTYCANYLGENEVAYAKILASIDRIAYERAIELLEADLYKAARIANLLLKPYVGTFFLQGLPHCTLRKFRNAADQLVLEIEYESDMGVERISYTMEHTDIGGVMAIQNPVTHYLMNYDGDDAMAHAMSAAWAELLHWAREMEDKQ